MATKYRLSDFVEAKEIILTDKENNETYTMTFEFPFHQNSSTDAFSKIKHITGGIFGNYDHIFMTCDDNYSDKDFFFKMALGNPLKIMFSNSELIIKDYEVEITKRSKVIFDKSERKYKFEDEKSEPETDEGV